MRVAYIPDERQLARVSPDEFAFVLLSRKDCLSPWDAFETAPEDVLSLTHGASLREKDRIPFGWCFRTQPCKKATHTNKWRRKTSPTLDGSDPTVIVSPWRAGKEASVLPCIDSAWMPP